MIGPLSPHEFFNQSCSEDLGKGSRVRVVSNVIIKLKGCKDCPRAGYFRNLLKNFVTSSRYVDTSQCGLIAISFQTDRVMMDVGLDRLGYHLSI